MPGNVMPGSFGIIVMGPFRSGTSLTSRMLAALGADFGPSQTMLKADRFNPDGYFQHAAVRIANNRLIKSAGSAVAWPDHPQVLAAKGDLTLLKRTRLDWRPERCTWGIKDPRFCASLLAWIEADVFDPSRLRIIRVERAVADAAIDLLGMPELACQLAERTMSSAQSTLSRYAEFAAWHAHSLGIPSFAFSYDQLIAAPKQCVADLSDFIQMGTQKQMAVAAAYVRRSP